MSSWNPVTFVRNASRNSPWIVMAVALHLILLAVAMVFYTSNPESSGEFDTRIVPAGPRTVSEVLPEPPRERERKALPNEMPAELTDLDTYVPAQEPSLPSEVLGDPNADTDAPPGRAPAGTAIGVGPLGQPGGGPTAFPGRDKIPGKGGDRGTSEQTELRVLAGLRWLARHQNADGSWGAQSLAGRCDAEHPCSDPHKSYVASYDEGLTAMALLAFLGAGHGHSSAKFIKDPVRGNEKIVLGDVVTRGLKWLISRQNPDGSFGKDRPFLYNQALATMALCEAHGLTSSRYWRDPAQRAVNYLQGAQRPSPTGEGLWGWRYASRQEIERFHRGDTLDEGFKKELFDADTSVTAWAVMALKSGRMTGLEVKQENFDGALTFAKWVSTVDGQAGYIDPKGAGAKVTGPDDHFDYHAAGMSALSMCIRAFTAHDVEDPYLEAAARRVAADLPRVSKDRLTVDYYYWYYGSLALNQFDGPDSPRGNGKYWRAWKKAMEEAVLAEQRMDVKDCGLGGWLDADRWCHAGGPIYATAINVLTLEVYYRYPNAFVAGRVKATGIPAPEAVK